MCMHLYVIWWKNIILNWIIPNKHLLVCPCVCKVSSFFDVNEMATLVVSDPISSGQLKCICEQLFPSMLAADVCEHLVSVSTSLIDTPLSQVSHTNCLILRRE